MLLDNILFPAIWAVLIYILGSINFSILVFRLLGKDDPRNHFSGNAGVTNVYRQAGIIWATIVFLLDVGRSIAIAQVSSRFFHPELVPWCCCILILANRFPLFHGFRGGKGVACYLGFYTTLIPLWAAGAAASWVAAYALIRTPFIASFFMIIVIATGSIFQFGISILSVAGCLIAALLIVFNHRRNIAEYRGKF